MNDSKLKLLVSEAVHLDREISSQTERLKELKKTLQTEATTRKEEQITTAGGGWSLTFAGADGCIARVTQPAAKLATTIDAEKPGGARTMELVGKLKDELFTPVLRYAPVNNFRDRAVELLAPAVARKVIKACESESRLTVSFETKPEA